MERLDYFNFSTEMSERQIYVREFFSVTLLDSIRRNFGLDHVVIFCFDTEGNFLSTTDRNGVYVASAEHPFERIESSDVLRHVIYRDAVRDKLTYFDTEPRVYRASDVIGKEDYEYSSCARFLQEFCGGHYAAVMAMGINAYIRILFWKTKAEGDFSDAEMKALENIHTQIAHAYKNFKKYEHSKIISAIQNLMIESGEVGAYLVTDDFQHVMSYNQLAVNYLSDMFGNYIADQIKRSQSCSWLSFLIGEAGEQNAGTAFTTEIKGYCCKSYTYDQSYTHGIVDRYHWIVISRKGKQEQDSRIEENRKLVRQLTPTEQKVASLLCEGLTYQQIADQLVVSYHTVKTHVQNIFTKCNVKNRHQLYLVFKS